MSITSSFYEENAESLAGQYNALPPTMVHHVWEKYWPSSGNDVLDIGAGSGRDSLWLTTRGCQVIACEPCNKLREIGEALTGKDVYWSDDKLPNLDRISKQGQTFDVILLSAVWMHIPINLRKSAIQTLGSLLKRDGIIVLSLRYGPFRDRRESFPVSVTELKELASKSNLTLVDVFDGDDMQCRQEVSWQTVVMLNK
ncbi:class I SAM-dependent methyltransferase [Vibrio sp. ZSDZ65]|uniref:Class I SAM-dependent methyltransferase n=1 Tax=Vibrio qingdaonensis TaxID=2829491 RepID=A0A9X3HYC0_9VIBR|nr:class I SAM-dependent methyltransferase [Vibrio qingdaonensis]MCW8348396.1 class I SAM-dependent methyltransferase [Vibrio qingdaonensis]